MAVYDIIYIVSAGYVVGGENRLLIENDNMLDFGIWVFDDEFTYMGVTWTIWVEDEPRQFICDRYVKPALRGWIWHTNVPSIGNWWFVDISLTHCKEAGNLTLTHPFLGIAFINFKVTIILPVVLTEVGLKLI